MKNKILQGIALASVVAVSSGVNVKADETIKSEEKQDIVSVSEEKSVTEADVKASEAKLTEATIAVKAQKAVVAKAEAEKTQAETVVSDSEQALVEAETLVEQVTPEAIKAVKAEIAKTEIALSEADKAISGAETYFAKANKAVVDQEIVVASLQSDLTTKAEAVKEAEVAVDKSQAILDGTNQASVIAEAEEAKTVLETAQADLTSAEADLAKAKEADLERQEAMTSLTNKVETAQSTLESKQETLTQASAKAEETGTALGQAQKNVIEAENKVNAINTISFSPEYIQALTDYMEHYSEKGDEAKKMLDSLAEAHRAKNQFKSNVSDDDIVLDTNHLSEDVLLDLSNFASDLINQIRRAFGKPETVVTSSAIRFADVVTDGYVSDDWSWQDVTSKGHDKQAIALAARQLGLKDDNQYYENLNSFDVSHQKLTLSDAKKRIYNSLVSFMFNGWEYLHAESIVGRYNAGTTYLAVDFSARSHTTGVHFLLVDDSHILDQSKFDKTTLDNPYNSEVIRKAYDIAKTTYTKAKELDDKAKLKQTQAQESYLASQDELNKANQALATVKAQPVLTPSAQARRDMAKVKEVEVQTRYAKAQEALANLSADVKVKREVLSKAKEVLATKVEAKEVVANRLSKEEAKLNQLKIVANDKKALLSTAKASKTALQEEQSAQKNYLERLTNAPKGLDLAKSTLAKAQEELAKAMDTLEAELKTLKDLETREADVKAYQDVLEAKRQAELERQKAGIEKSGQIAVPVFDEQGLLTSYVVDKKKVGQNELPTLSRKKQFRPNKSGELLPKTNSQPSLLLSLIGLLTLSSGIFVSKWKRQ